MVVIADKEVTKMNVKIIIPALVLAILGLGAYGVSQVYAGESSDQYLPIVQRLSEKLGVSEEKVEASFDEMRAEKQVQMQARFEERLDQMIEDGDLTQEQKQAILDKHQELQTKYLQEREELKVWAEENGIDLKNVFFGPHCPKGQGFGQGKFGL
jgi:hypothetical protein